MIRFRLDTTDSCFVCIRSLNLGLRWRISTLDVFSASTVQIWSVAVFGLVGLLLVEC